MAWAPWFDNRLTRAPRRSVSEREPTQPAPLCLRRLEPRRVLNAATGIVVPLTALEGETVTVATENLDTPSQGGPSIDFDWTITREGTVVEQPAIKNLTATDTTENGISLLRGDIVPVKKTDSFTLQVDWGDGETETFNVAAGTTQFFKTHFYLDDDPTGTSSDMPTITVSLTDGNGGTTQETVSPTVSNVAPFLGPVLERTADEGGTITLNPAGEPLLVAFVDIGSLDTHTATIDWGDGSAIETLAVTESDGLRAGRIDGSHTYADNGSFTATITLTDDDGGVVTESFLAVVSNVTPKIENLTATDTTENGISLLRGDIVDPGVLDSFTLQVDWGDGETETFTLAAGTTSFLKTHFYLDDDPTGTPVDTPTITVTLTDKDGGSTTESVSPKVSNVAPFLGPVLDRTIDEGGTVTLNPAGEPLLVAFVDIGSLDTHIATIDWGDGTPLESLLVTESDGLRAGRLDGSHTYADNGNYTATITITDDDTGQAQQSFVVHVANVDPALTGTNNLSVNEGTAFTLAGMGVGVSDPGFDNPLNTADPSNGGEVAETFLDGSIDWGDGSAATPVTFVSRVSGSEGVPTTASLDHTAHHYADNGIYTVTVTLADDDGAAVERSFQITVHNVAPTLTLNDPNAIINEGTRIELPSLGTFFDPGFNNPAGGTAESFSYSIDWGDGTVDTLQLPASVAQGSAGTLTTGTLAAEHFYADNDADNLYTISVTLSDDDGGSDTKSFDVTVLNVNPTLDPIAATDLKGDGITYLTLTFADPGADEFEVLVDWGERLDLPPADRFVVERLTAGPTPQTFIISHRYFGPPDPLHPTDDIIISVKIRDDDFAVGTALAPGESNIESVAITNPGIEDNAVAIDTTPQAPAIDFPPPLEVTRSTERPSDEAANQQNGEEGAASSELSIGSERYLELRLIAPDGTEGEGHRLRGESLDDLPALFSRLPDNHYRIYVVQTETNSRRLVIDVNLRGGRPIDPSDDSDGARDRPPTDDGPLPDAPLRNTEPSESEELLEELPAPPPTPHQAQAVPPQEQGTGNMAPAAAAVLGATTRGDRIERALSRASEDRWQRLHRRNRR